MLTNLRDLKDSLEDTLRDPLERQLFLTLVKASKNAELAYRAMLATPFDSAKRNHTEEEYDRKVGEKHGVVNTIWDLDVEDCLAFHDPVDGTLISVFSFCETAQNYGQEIAWQELYC